MSYTIPGVPIVMHPIYLQQLGVFHSNWSQIDLYTDYAIYQFLGVTAEQAHLITSGMMFGRKASLLSDLIYRSNDPRKQALQTSFNLIRAAKRAIISHSYVYSDDEELIFLERISSGSFKAKEHRFSLDEFLKHVQGVHDACIMFCNALEVDQDKINAFASAAFNLSNKESTSPGNPTDNK